MEEDVIIVYLADFEFAGSETYGGKRFYAYRDVLFDFISERDLRWFWGRLDLREGALRDNSVILLSHIFSGVSLRRGFYYRLHVKGLLSMQRRPEFDPESPRLGCATYHPGRAPFLRWCIR